MKGVVAAVLVAVCCVSADDPDLITNLPGAPSVSFKQYAGYININATQGRNLFYWLVESQRDPANDPLVLWLNGGPGCSSLGGFLTENGPFFVNLDGKTLRTNPESWNRIANVVYLESPSGVGFSYSTNTSDYTVGDQRTAYDSWVFLTKFLAKFPKFANAPFWVTGESYGGHYVPNLARTILQQNAIVTNPKINLAGFQVGNAWTVAAIDNQGAAEFWWTHALISDSSHQGMMDNCDFSKIGPLRDNPDPAKCNAAIRESNTVMRYINIYNIYADVCLKGQQVPINQATQLVKSLAESGATTPYSSLLTQDLTYDAHLLSAPNLGDQLPDPDPCVGIHLAQYLNLPEVQKAIHASIPYPWTDCTGRIRYSRDDLLSSMVPVYQDLFKSSIRMLIYSGDIDAIVPVTGTRWVLKSMNLTTTEEWRAWIDREKQVGGYTTKYKELTFATVRDSGHMVPWVQPMRSYELYSRFLNGQPL
jgi:serine carboxypeptidase-like clade 2